MSEPTWPLWEVFVRSEHGLAHKHVGSLHAPDAEMALLNARDAYTRRNEGLSIWVVKSSDVFSGAADGSQKAFRYPTYFNVPDGVKHL